MAKAPVGVLLLHGLTSHINCIDPVVPRIEKHGLPYRMPFLRGHGTKWEDLRGVKWKDWVEDGQKAFNDLLKDCEQVIIVSLSMGSLVGLNLALANPNKTKAIVCMVPAMKLKTKMDWLIPILARFQKTQKMGDPTKFFFDLEQAKTNQNYTELPTDALVDFIKFGKYTRNQELLKQITQPILILGTPHDVIIDPTMPQHLYDSVSSKDKRLLWFNRTNHEMLRDAQREEVLDAIEAFVVEHAVGKTQATTIS